MKLINDFYHIVAIDDSEGKYVCKVKLNAAHNIYSVHFPGNPVTPGVCLVQMVTEILELKFEKRLVLSTAVNIKFKRLVAPNDEPSFVFSKIVIEDGLLKTIVSIEDEQGQFVKMSLQYKTVD
jgi:3-hydroxyacyl-[acyl-carrier-protein] dehydratase